MSRIDFSRREDYVNSGIRDYVFNGNASIRESTLCNGPSNAPGVMCSDYGMTRQSIAGPDPNRNSLFHRSDNSSGGPVLQMELDDDRPLSREQMRIMNRGSAMQPTETRGFQTTANLMEQPILADYRSIPNREAQQFNGFMAFQGMNQSTRTQARNETERRFIDTKCIGQSAKSYGSYGLF